MNCFLGIIVLSPLNDRVAFSRVVKEITHHLHLHQSQIKITETSHLISIQALHNTNTFTISKQEAFVHTCHHHITFSENVSEAELSYFKIVLECLMIVKEHFPSKIQIQLVADNEHLQTRLDRELDQSSGDLSRRYISHLRGLASNGGQITLQQVNDIFHILRTQDSSKLVTIALGILKKVPVNLLSEASQIEIKTLERLSEQEQYEKNAVIILNKIKERKNSLQNNLQQSRKSSVTSKSKFDQPTILNSFTFQLRESNNIERLSFLIEKISSQLFKLEKESIQKLDCGIYNAIGRLLDEGRLNNTKQTMLFVDNVLKYSILRKQIKDWQIVVELLNEVKSFPVVKEGITGTLAVFVNQFQQICDRKFLIQVQMIRLQITQQNNYGINQSKSYEKQNNGRRQIYQVNNSNDGCVTSRSKMIKHKINSVQTK